MELNLREIADYAKKKLEEATDNVVLTAASGKACQVKFANNKIVKSSVENNFDIGVFVTKDKKILVTNIKDIPTEKSDLQKAKKKVDESVSNVKSFLKFVEPKQDYFGIAGGPFKYKKIHGLFDKKISEFDLNETDVVRAGMNAALREGAERTNGIFQLGAADVLLLTSGNVDVESQTTAAYFSIRAMVGKEASGHMTSNARTLKELAAEDAGKFAGEIANVAKNPVAGKAGKYDVLFSPLAFSVIAQNFGEAASIFDIEANLSFFKNKLNKQIGPKGLNICDDATIAGGIASSEYDMEGVPTKKIPVLENGILKTYLHNTSSARKYKTKTTGNAGLMAPGPHNVVFEAGKGTRDDLIREVKRGIYITNLWYLRYQNMSAGDFSVIPRDGVFQIKNGQILRPLKQLRVSDNMLNVLKNIYLRGNDIKQMAGWETSTPVHTPHVVVKNINITRPTG
ncbi:MAG: TldD/PmbA family protein [DPANN group archaeon]|nr:TldD/PmbA family protein [DPANN group archaeon]